MITSNAVAFTKERAQAQHGPRVKKEETDQRQAANSQLLPMNPDQLVKFVPVNETAAPVASRARSYLGANCAHCHTMYGGGNSAMEFDWFGSEQDLQAIDRLPQHGNMDVPGARVIAAGAPGKSVLVPRVAKRGPGQMPPIGSRVADPDGVRILAEWIESLRPQ